MSEGDGNAALLWLLQIAWESTMLAMGQVALISVIEASGGLDVVLKYLDFCLLASVWRLANDIVENEPRLDLFVNNAGRTEPFQQTLDYRGPYRATTCTTTRTAARTAFKLYNVYFAHEMTDKLRGERVTVNALHPGLLKSRSFREPATTYFLKFLWRKRRAGGRSSCYCYGCRS
ncbi:uncharacterized protein LOC119394847 [Rhipicephalus sanguineus]|uniref:uncharacterized protein LOC119394847 n=1 Tax=Rhipicephalus sanguineus TaxID=34632 RepID=UPI001892DD19|nr:uncharacterized protein LOC119394847 [Rhipicephalus sanguineus]